MKSLIIVDMQNDFCNPNGSLYVKGAENLIPVINHLILRCSYDLIVATQDWHPPKHISFASFAGRKPFVDKIKVAYGMQDLWPDHCVQGTWGAQLADGLALDKVHMITRKGFNVSVDSYSAFVEANGDQLMSMRYLYDDDDRIDIVGVATDYCVRATAIDCYNKHSHNTHIITSGCAGVAPETSKKALDEMYDLGIRVHELYRDF